MTYSIDNVKEFIDTFNLEDSVVVSDDNSIEFIKDADIDLAGSTIASNIVISNSVVTIYNGNIDCTGVQDILVTGKDSVLNLKDIDIIACDEAISVKGRSNVNMQNCKISIFSDSKCPAFVVEGSTVAKNNSQLTLDSCTIVGNNMNCIQVSKRGILNLQNCILSNCEDGYVVDDNSIVSVDEDTAIVATKIYTDSEDVVDIADKVSDDVGDSVIQDEEIPVEDEIVVDEPIEAEPKAEPEAIEDDVAVESIDNKEAESKVDDRPIDIENIVFKKPTQVYGSPSRKFKQTMMVGPAKVLKSNTQLDSEFICIKYKPNGKSSYSIGYVLASAVKPKEIK